MFDFSGDGRRAIVATGEAAVFDLETGAAVVTSACRIWPRPAFSHEGRFLVVPNTNRIQVRDLDLPTDSPPVAEILLPLSVTAPAVACDASGRWAIAGTVEGDLYVVDMAQRCLAGSPIRHSASPIDQLAINPQVDAVGAADVEGTLRVWSVPGGLPLTPPLRHEEPIGSLAWRDDGRQLAAATVSGDITVWDLSRVLEPPCLRSSIRSLAVSADGRRLLTWGKLGEVSIWDLTTRPPRQTASLSGSPILAASWSPDGDQVALVARRSVGQHLECRLWRPPDPQATSLHLQGLAYLNVLAGVVGFMDGRDKLALGGPSGPVVFDLDQGSESLRFDVTGSQRHERLYYAISDRWLAGCRHLMSSTRENPLQVWTPAGQEVFRTLLPSGQNVQGLAFSPDGDLLAAIGDFGLRLWRCGDWRSIKTGSSKAELGIGHMCFDAGSAYLAFVDSNSMCRVARVQDEFACGRPFQLPRNVSSLCFSPDGQRLAVVTVRHGVVVWDWSRGEPLTPAYRQDCILNLPRSRPMVRPWP